MKKGKRGNRAAGDVESTRHGRSQLIIVRPSSDVKRQEVAAGSNPCHTARNRTVRLIDFLTSEPFIDKCRNVSARMWTPFLKRCEWQGKNGGSVWWEMRSLDRVRAGMVTKERTIDMGGDFFSFFWVTRGIVVTAFL